ncbi:EFR1 family ferrodoxin [Saccharicrinis aurantiacus]|uniref:EFR1 family ferrodoxin n=1 Tax=Saccharicrinis aurantiacus TaxID=1849719 RepID=UPI00094FC4E1|nr:EFR1 family ferrodoxin [Saccharicrinis aurantiacus]
MEFIIIHFSGTGNTELISNKIKQRLERNNHRVDLISIEDIDMLKTIDFSDKVIGFGYPVYKFTFPDNYLKVFPVLQEKCRNNTCFQFCTYARFTADVFYDFSKKLKKLNFKLIGQKSFKSPSNGISARKPENDYEYENVMFFEDDITRKIDDFVIEILDNINGHRKIVQKKPHILAPLRLKIVKDIEITKYPKLQIDTDACKNCGLCAKKCPDSNLVNQGDYIEIVDNKDCLHCLRCMHHCPSNAINFGKLTQGDNRYTIKKRNCFFEKSAGGHKERYWEDFDRTRAIWRKNTIKYWWKHRNKPEKELVDCKKTRTHNKL